MDNELFELCKEVYKRTDWRDDSLNHWTRPWTLTGGFKGEPFVSNIKGNQVVKEDGTGCPLYTSDYLLEKIDEKIGEQKIVHVFSMFDIETYEKYFRANVGTPGSIEVDTERTDTPRKALLKLVIALDDAGEL